MLLCRPSRYYSFFVIPTPTLLIFSFCYSDTQITNTPLLSLPYLNYQYSPFVIPTPKLPILPFCFYHSATPTTNNSPFAMLPPQSLILPFFTLTLPEQSPVAYSRFATYSATPITNSRFCQSAAQTTNTPLFVTPSRIPAVLPLYHPAMAKTLVFPFKHIATTNTNAAPFSHCASFSRMQANGQR